MPYERPCHNGNVDCVVNCTANTNSGFFARTNYTNPDPKTTLYYTTLICSMSTFDGFVSEFPDIQIDYFRKSPDRQPLACLLSHVHSDHLQGLESVRAPFIYCSPATRELLLRIEKYPHRMNFHKGILESRRLHYKHLAKLLRPIPLNTPTEIELTPRRRIRVTLFDANHCSGAVMFLIEGNNKAIIYSGDIRAEKWWVDSLIRNPILIPYTLGHKRLDKLYLDTTFAQKSNPFREFPSKAEGLAELLRKVEAYSDDTVFYFRAWTFGYEDVWLALSAALGTKIHVDRYQMGLYRSLVNISSSRGVNEGPALCGFDLGNRAVSGCLSDSESSRIHSCEPDVSCRTAQGPKTVYIMPIINRTKDGAEVSEVGAGGGIGDLYQVHELELPDESTLAQLEKLCLQQIPDKKRSSQMQKALLEAFQSRKKALSLDIYGVKEEGDMSLEKLVAMLGQGVFDPSSKQDLPNTIVSCIYPSGAHYSDHGKRFPYSRHSSYSELCELVAAFRPKDIHPCTVDPSTWNEDVSICCLFGHLCSGSDFAHDNFMRQTIDQTDDDDGQRSKKRARYEVNISTESSQSSDEIEDQTSTGDTEHKAHSALDGTVKETSNISQPTANSQPSLDYDPERAKRAEIQKAHLYLQEHADPSILEIGPLPPTSPETQARTPTPKPLPHVSSFTSTRDDGSSPRPHEPSQVEDSQHTDLLSLSISESDLNASPPSDIKQGLESTQDHTARRRARVSAYLAAREDSWADISLVSAGGNHAAEEMEL
ncbi:DNA repair metallo-beta-lactamase [Penicillium atrosanguineum]|nr:DNA repair metallo-beta-lactamase [Penicillium atrosanguineum]